MMRTGEAGLQFIRDEEGLGPKYKRTGRIVAYLCPQKVPTIGYGHTRTVNHTDVGVREISLEQAESILRHDVQVNERYVNSLKLELNQNQFDALISLTHNCGSFGDGLIGHLRAKRWKQACATIKRYIHASNGDEPCGGRCGVKGCKLRTFEGLITRRAEEVKLFMKPVEDAP